MAFETPYQQQPEQAIASYNYTDIADGFGMVAYYGLASHSGWLLSSQPFYSTTIEIGGVSNGGDPDTWTELQNVDLDTNIFNFTKYIKGTALLEVCYEHNQGTSVAPSSLFYFYIYKVDSADTETLLGSASIYLWNSVTRTEASVLKIPLNETTMNAGDKLRLNIVISGMTSSGNLTSYIGTDPINRDGTYITPSTDENQSTQLKLHIPFKIEL